MKKYIIVLLISLLFGFKANSKIIKVEANPQKGFYFPYFLKIPKNMNQNKMIKNKKIKTNGTIDFINGQRNFLSESIYNLNPKVGDLLLFPNYLMHTAYPFNIEGERRSFSFNAKIILTK